MAEDKSYIAALLHERQGYLDKGRLDRVADVEAELTRLGAMPAVVFEPPPVADKPKAKP